MSSVTSFSLTRSISGTRRKKANRLRQNRERLANSLDSKPGVGLVVRSISNMRPASLRLIIILAGSIGLISYAIAGPTPVSPGGAGYNTQPVISNNGAPASNNFGTQTAPTNNAANSTSSSPGNSGSSSSGDENPNIAG